MKLSRRFWLKGMLGGATATLGLPLLEAMLDAHGEALASGEPLPKRFGVFFWGNGVVPTDWLPVATGAAWAPTVALQPLHDLGVVPDIAVVSGMRLELGTGCHASGRALLLSGSYDGMTPEAPPGISAATTMSCDQIAADNIGGETTFRSIELAVSQAGPYGNTDSYSCSWRDANLLPAESSPSALFGRLFTGFEPDDSFRQGRLSVLDAVLADADRLHGKLGNADRQRLEAHLDALRELEVRIEAEPPACQIPAAPVDPAGTGPEPLRERSDLLVDIIATALTCDLTRVFSIRFSQALADTVFSEVGATEGHHTLSHANTAVHTSTVAFTIERFAYLVKKLADTPEGEGRLLDSCAILGTTELGDGSTHSVEDMPMLVAGQAGGALKTGFHHREAVAGTRASAVPFTLLQAVGVPITTFGDGQGYVDVPVAALQV
jgi:hypothetical protein